jgi:hypothetical protein
MINSYWDRIREEREKEEKLPIIIPKDKQLNRKLKRKQNKLFYFYDKRKTKWKKHCVIK